MESFVDENVHSLILEIDHKFDNIFYALQTLNAY